MLRLSLRLSTALLWLAIALVPMRGWATAWMPLAMDHGVPAAAVDADTVPPCHEQAGDGNDSAPSTCAMCDLCHSAAAQAPDTPAQACEPHAALPLATAAVPVEPASPDGPYRPPRSTRT